MTAYLALAVIFPAVLHLFKFNVFAADPVQSQLSLSLKEKAPKRVRTGRIFKFLCLLYSLGAMNE